MKRTKIVLDGRCLQDGSADRGVGRYVRGLLCGLAELTSEKFEFGIVFDRKLADSGARPWEPDGRVHGIPASVAQTEVRRLPAWQRSWRFNESFRANGAELLHVPAQFYGYHWLRITVPYVINVHDLIPLLPPESDGEPRRAARRLRRLSDICQRARRVMVLSQAGLAECVDRLGIAPERIAVIPLGVDDAFSPVVRDDTEVRKRLGIGSPYFLYVGASDRHKNLSGLLEAYQRFRRDHGADHELILAGRFDEMKRERLPAGVYRIGFVPDAELAALYRMSTAFVSMSRHEGFALPVVEAMACGTPVVAPRASAFPETMGEAGLLVDPDDAGATSHALSRLVREPRLAAELRERGLKRAARFQWRHVAETTLAVYQTALEEV